LMQEKIKNKELKYTETTTTQWLSQVEQDIVKKEVLDNTKWWDKTQDNDNTNRWGDSKEKYWEEQTQSDSEKIEVVDKTNWWETTSV
jgi:hypothetical protein